MCRRSGLAAWDGVCYVASAFPAVRKQQRAAEGEGAPQRSLADPCSCFFSPCQSLSSRMGSAEGRTSLQEGFQLLQ